VALVERIEKGEALVDDAQRAAAGAAQAHEAATEALTAADRQLEHLRTEHRAAHLASGLAVGDDCPVCHRPLTEVPAHDVADVDDAERAREAARAEAERARSTLDNANRQHESYTTLLASLREQLDELAAADDPAPRDELAGRLDAIVRAEEALERARTARRTAEERRKKSESRRKKIAKLEKSAWGEFDDVRDKVAVLTPPSAERDDVGRAWQSLCDWAELRRRELADERATVHAALSSLASTRTDLLASLRASFAEAGLDVVDEGHREVVVAARARVESELDHLSQLEVQAGTRREARTEAAASEQVAGEVGNLLKANAFEKWLLDEAMRALVAGGSVKLEELSRGQYSLAVDVKTNGFLVVDHHNADEERSARTLSGGETFLASLALALALAEQVADLAADGAPRLESLFLDEGFGTLDPDTLEVVVAAIEELQAGGLMVGLVSHVVELAERVPVRFEITKGPNGSSVERVDQ
jgi:exonuclease SbcC